MAERKLIYRFSPNRTAPEDLERIHVQRHDLLARAVELMRESALTPNKHHLLYVGPRGCGKTHLITLIEHRLKRQKDLEDRLRIAWLNEDETSTSFLDLLVRIYTALSQAYPKDFPKEDLERIYGGPKPDECRAMLGEALVRRAEGRTILVLIENLDALFRQLDNEEQQSWRGYIQNHPIFATVATAQSLFDGANDRDCPFFGFFDTEMLKMLTPQEAVEMLGKVAVLNGDKELEDFLKTERGRARIQAIHHLSGGNHRLHVVLSDFVTAESLRTLVEPFETLVDEQLTPYYQERLRWISPLQRKIVEFLCRQPGPTTVKDIAERLFSEHASIASQLKKLKEMGYVENHARGRESLYELAEPLMRLSMQVKDARGRQPLSLIVDFLRVWYEREDLEKLLTRLDPTLPGRAYIEAALARLKPGEPNLRHEIWRRMLINVDVNNCTDNEFNVLKQLATESSKSVDSVLYASACQSRGHHAEAIGHFTIGLSRPDLNLDTKINILYYRALAFGDTGQFGKAFKDFSSILDVKTVPQKARRCYYSASVFRGFLYTIHDDHINAQADFARVVNAPDAEDRLREYSSDLLASCLFGQDKWEKAISHVFHMRHRNTELGMREFFKSAIAAIFRHITSPEVWKKRVEELVALCAEKKLVPSLGDALVRHLSEMDTSLINAEGLDQWVAQWEATGKAHLSLRVPLRLLRVGVEYLKTNPRDEGVLLALPKEERRIVRSALKMPDET